MSKQVEFFFDCSSPWTYLAFHAIQPLRLANHLRAMKAASRDSDDSAPVELSLETIGNRLRFQVRDHGPGIAADDLQHLTQRFWRNSTSNGCGLGLAIVQAIVQRCGCVLHFDSRPDGLRVELTLPLQA